MSPQLGLSGLGLGVAGMGVPSEPPDEIAPTVELVEVQTGLTVDVTFSEPMGTGVTTASNYTVSGTGKGSLASNPNSVALVSGNVYRCTWSSGKMFNGGNITIAVANAQDLAGNAIDSSGTDTGGAIASSPTVVITATGATNNVLAVSITFSEPVTGFVVGDITISGGSLANFAGSGESYTVDWTLPAGAATMDIGAGVCVDGAGNGNTAATQYNAGYLTMQPDSSADIDTYIKGGDGSNYATAGGVWLGYVTAANRPMFRFDLSSIPATANVSSSLDLYMEAEASANARRMSLYRIYRDWVVTQATWTKYTTADTWQTAGCNGAGDREQTEWVGKDLSATEAAGHKIITLPAVTKSDMGSYGWIAILSDETGDRYLFDFCNNATADRRPKLTVVYWVNP